jgi:hypothetical protein
LPIYTVDLYVFFLNGTSTEKNMKRLEDDLYKANSCWRGCVQFNLKGVFHSKRRRVVNADSIPSNNVFKHRQIDSFIKAARSTVGHKTGIYIFYLNGDYFAEGRGKSVVAISGTELVHFHSDQDYELFGRILLTDMATRRYTLAHELGHVLFKRYNTRENRFIHSDPSGPYKSSILRRIDHAHNSSRKNLMFPISPTENPTITFEQCQVAKQGKLVKVQYQQPKKM